MDKDSVLEEGEQKELEKLTSELLSLPGPDSPGIDVVGRLYVACFRHFVHVFERRANDRRRAEDATQEAFKALQIYYEKHHALPDDPRSFLFVAARNWLANQARTAAYAREVPLGEQSSSTLDGLLDPHAEARQPFEAVASEEIREVADGALQELDPGTRRVIELRRKGKTWPEIARSMKLASAEFAKKKFQHAVHCVKSALGEQFSSFVTTAEIEVRRCINRRRSAEQAIDLLPPPYDELLHLLLIEKKTEQEVAQLRETSLDVAKRDHEHAVELLYKKYKMTEDELLEVLWHGR
ncbi:MAG: sigma-70 family RNA polymerase sigma factor [Planctomycetes bacterium]|nr:sigma-70 family RNA polymerase sigma factor [Planctomycetota bacterium]